jgi:hypothetical protein
MIGFDGNGATVPRHDVAGNGEPEPASSLGPAARLIHTREAFEDLTSWPSGMPAPSSATVNTTQSRY